MQLDHILICTDTIPILNETGEQLEEVKLPEKIMPTPRRRCGCSKSHTFYKGAGIIYRGNYTNTTDDNMIIVSKNTAESLIKYSVLSRRDCRAMRSPLAMLHGNMVNLVRDFF